MSWSGHESSPSPTTPLRADAERNRQRILEVAGRVFAERGIDATLNDIAHEAGVGVGTVYRKFADKNALIEQLTEEKLQSILARVDAVSTRSSARDALREMLLGAAAVRASDRRLFQILLAAGAPSVEREGRAARLLHAWDGIIERAVREGAVRPGFSSADVDLFMIMVGAVADATQDVEPLAWRRSAQILLDGFGLNSGDSALEELHLDDETRRAIFLNG